MKKIYLVLMLGIMFLSLVGAEVQTLGAKMQNGAVNLIQTCDNSTYSNITRIMNPDSSFAIDEHTEMTKNGFNYNYSFGDTSALGQYIVYGECDEDGVVTSWVYDFKITPSGMENIGAGQGLSITSILSVMIIIGVGFFISGLYFNNLVSKITFVSLGIIVFIMVILFAVINIQQNLGGFNSIITGAESFWFVMKMLLTIGIVAFFIIIALILYKAWKVKRGYVDT